MPGLRQAVRRAQRWWPADEPKFSGMGVGYGTGNIGKVIGPLGLALIVGTSNYVHPQALFSRRSFEAPQSPGPSVDVRPF